MTIKRGSVIECTEAGPHGKPVIAVVGYAGDWTAYEQSYPDQITPDLIARQGDKISQDAAEELFPELAKALRWRP